MKNLSIWGRICATVLSLLGLQACFPKMYGPAQPDYEVEYGCPYAEYKINGRVVDADDSPVGDVVVSRGFDSVVTSSDGRFTLSGSTIYIGDTLHVNVHPGENFQPEKDIVVGMKKIQDGDSGWFRGGFVSRNDVTVKLTAKDEKEK